MRWRAFPDEPSRRRVVLVLTEHDIERCAYEPGAAKTLLVNDQAHILRIPITANVDLPTALRNIQDARLASSGAMLIQSPYDTDRYVEAADAAADFALEKYMIFSMFCKHLGAKAINVEHVTIHTRQGVKRVDVKLARPAIDADVSAEVERSDSFVQRFTLNDKFAGEVADFQSAEQLARRTGLLNDVTMSSLLAMRRDEKNPIKTRSLNVSLSTESATNIRVAACLHIPTWINLAANYKSVFAEQKQYKLAVKVTF